MTFSISHVAASLAGYLAPSFPGVTFYEDPNQQGSEPPMMFLQQRYAYIDRRLSGRFLRRIGLDLTYLLDYSLPDMQQQYQAAAEALDMVMDSFPYTDDTGTTLILTHDREWRIDQDAMHYQFEIRVWVTLPEDFTPMETMDYSEVVTDGTEKV